MWWLRTLDQAGYILSSGRDMPIEITIPEIKYEIIFFRNEYFDGWG
jgi:hypothetical protein